MEEYHIAFKTLSRPMTNIVEISQTGTVSHSPHIITGEPRSSKQCSKYRRHLHAYST